MSPRGPEEEGTGASRSHSESGGTSFPVPEVRPRLQGDVWEPHVNSDVFPGKVCPPSNLLSSDFHSRMNQLFSLDRAGRGGDWARAILTRGVGRLRGASW